MKNLSIGLLGLILLVVAIGLVLPTEYRIEESIVIDAPASEVHALLDDLERWPDWAPWHELDDTIVTTYGELTTGVGAHQSWTSQDGDGELTITRSDPSTGIAYDMAFIMGETRAPSTASMDMSPSGDGTQVTWIMEGDVSDFMPPVMSGLMNIFMKREIASMFQLGLGNLKELAEAP